MFPIGWKSQADSGGSNDSAAGDDEKSTDDQARGFCANDEAGRIERMTTYPESSSEIIMSVVILEKKN